MYSAIMVIDIKFDDCSEKINSIVSFISHVHLNLMVHGRQSETPNNDITEMVKVEATNFDGRQEPKALIDWCG